jgi:DNA ligase 1
MRAFVELYDKLDASTSTQHKVDALREYFASCPPADGAWALALFTQRRLKRLVTSTQLRAWASQAANVPMWMMDECYAAVGDLGETLSMILPERLDLVELDVTPRPAGNLSPATEPKISDLSLAELMTRRLLPLAKLDELSRRASVMQTWNELDQRQRFIFHKLISGTFRVGVSRLLAVRALALAANTEQPEMDHRLQGDWQPTAEFFSRLLRPQSAVSAESQTRGANPSLNPYPFFLAHQLDDNVLIQETLGDRALWQAEWKWDGIRGQLARRGGRTALWSRGEELLTDRFDEITRAATELPDGTTLDGEVLAFENGRTLGFELLATRIMRGTSPADRGIARLFHDVPVVFMAYDCLQHQGSDIRSKPLHERRAILQHICDELQGPARNIITPSTLLTAATWDQLAQLRASSRKFGVEGIMLKHLQSQYGTGRTKVQLVDENSKAGWWKWKIEPYRVDCVLIAAQRGSGRRASLYSDYTFAVWTGPASGEGKLVPIAKAYSGLTDAELLQVDAFVREHPLKKEAGQSLPPPASGIRMVEPKLVFEIAFEAISHSPRHASGIATRFPRIARVRYDKRADQADTLAFVQGLLAQHRQPIEALLDDRPAPLDQAGAS